MDNSYHIVRIQRYLNGELSRDEMYELEREALDDPLLQDAIDGYRMQKEVSHRQLSLLQQRLADRIAGQAKERNAFFFGWQRLGVAATACVLMVLVLVLLWMRNQPTQQPSAGKEVQVELTTPELPGNVHVVAAAGPGLDAYPEGGWDALNAYINSGLAGVSLKGKATLTFDIDAQGLPTDIQAVGEADIALLSELRRLLAEGPKWSGSRGQAEVTFE
ncbi:hypothetical protein [Parapedobacter sp. 10938]|uniref:hypothetical protein n=1 Tax=Parapedobacter flavus TaxID=3110225 RepID=UPI002DB59A17|nr:hypothetical protein [Parapedobacter sp. 10938]MEC3878232.1 hypothetical protein [Parapedobacter sp. 10938]